MSSVPAPLVLSRHNPSGVPSRLVEAAHEAKRRTWENSTLLEASESFETNSQLPVLPPDTTRDCFDRAILQLKTELGENHVVINDKPLVDGWYMEHPNTHDAFHIHSREDTVSSATIYPGSTEEVQLVVRWANKHLLPIYPISMGRNLGYGGAAPRVRGSIVLDLGKRMNKVLNIDGANCSCMVEPGVSYFALYEAVQESGHALWIDTPDLGGGSVIRYTPYGDHFGNHCGMEVVLPTGDVVRLGMGALPGKDGVDNPTWQSFQYGYGPYSDGIFTQSNFGIVTRMGFWLMPATGHLTQLRHAVQELAVTGKGRREFFDGEGLFWCLVAGTVYGSRTAQTASLDVIRQAFSVIPEAKFVFPDDVPPDHYLHSRVAICSGVPQLTDLNWLQWKPNGAHLFFSPISPTNGKDARKLYDIVKSRHEEFGFDMMPAFCIAPREMHFIDCLVYDRGDKSEKRRVVACLRAMIEDAAKEGYGEYRTHILVADQVAATYSWNNGALMRLNETLKDALDPNGILAPGRAGIWPKRFRGKGWEILSGDDRMWSTPRNTVGI